MEIYVVIEDIDDYPECGGGEYPDAVFLDYINAVIYVAKKKAEAEGWDEYNRNRTTWRIETWKTADKEE